MHKYVGVLPTNLYIRDNRILSQHISEHSGRSAFKENYSQYTLVTANIPFQSRFLNKLEIHSTRTKKYESLSLPRMVFLAHS